MGDSESDSENGSEERVLPAKDVYLLMKKDYRISRNIRASWFFHHINSVLEFSPESCVEETNKELTVVGVVMEEEAVVRFGTDDSPNASPPPLTDRAFISFRLVPSTVVHFIAKRYRLVFVLDFSPSALSVDLKTGEVFADKIFDSLKKCLLGLVKPFPLPGTNLLFESELFITVIAHTPMVVCTTNQVLVQGIRVTAANVAVVLDAVRTSLQVFEQSLYNDINLPSPDMTNLGDSLSRMEHSNPDQKPRTRNKSAELAINPEAGIINLLRQGFFALQLLPENSSAGIVVVTDGMLGVTDLNLFDTLLAQLRSSTIACSFLRIGQTQCARCSFGLVPHVELLQFISSTTFGTYIGDPPDEKEDYHRKLLIWSFQKSIREPLHVLPGYNNSACSYINVYAHPLKDYPDLIPIERKRQMDVKLNTSLSSVLSIRLREGFTLRNIIFLRGETQIKVELALLWRDYVKIEYCATAAWPQDKSRQHQTHVEMFVEGSYEFLHDAFSNECTLTMSRWSPIRLNRRKKFLLALTKLRQSDVLLSHLQGFASNPVNYKLPDSIKNGLSVFYIPLQSSAPTLNSQHNTKDAVLNQFVTFWKPVVHLDTKIWQKWMHSHRIGMVLEHDRPLSKYLHIPDSCGRFYFVFCRQAQLALQTLLQSWSTFVLVENTAYVKYLYEGESQSSKEHPTHFLLLRLSTSKAPCMTIKAAFLGGASGSMRYKVLKELKTKVFALKFKQGGSQIEKSKKSPKQEKETMVKRKPPLSRDWSETPCCIMLTKPMENILI
ncbi:KICSTOR complex protein SZT2-like, partial [Saccostrea cucullata]|uniref:KICSTOR complex protein SZT2-like n=1 Tax=Saccostrea cuccullata TaxID=36930 RepID=UPI002ED0D179